MNKLIVIQEDTDEYLRPDLCTPCGGHCCRTMPGSSLPTDLGDDIEAELVARLSTEKWAIDWWEGDPTDGDTDVYDIRFLRPATKGKEGELLDPSWGGACTFFKDGTGCTIFDERPSGCRGLEPAVGYPETCEPRWATKRDCAIAWIAYQEEIRRAIDAVEIQRESA